jgi:membrane-associated phospholipid phosphatase
MTNFHVSGRTGTVRSAQSAHDRGVEPGWASVARAVAIGYVAISAALIGVGLLVGGALARTRLVSWDERTVRWFAAHRTHSLNTISLFWSKLADAPQVVGVGIVVALVLALGRHWRQVALLAGILAVELGTFLTISYTVGRARPNVAHLGSVPSTGSFPSGHIAATIVLYGFITVLLWQFAAPRFVQIIAATWTVVAALAVGWARMYRGMHHPLDVLAGAVMGVGVVIVFIVAAHPGAPRNERNPS